MGRRNAERKAKHNEEEKRRKMREKQFTAKLQRAVMELAPEDTSERAASLRSCRILQKKISELDKAKRRKTHALRRSSDASVKSSLRAELEYLQMAKNPIFSDFHSLKARVWPALQADYGPDVDTYWSGSAYQMNDTFENSVEDLSEGEIDLKYEHHLMSDPSMNLMPQTPPFSLSPSVCWTGSDIEGFQDYEDCHLCSRNDALPELHSLRHEDIPLEPLEGFLGVQSTCTQSSPAIAMESGQRECRCNGATGKAGGAKSTGLFHKNVEIPYFDSTSSSGSPLKDSEYVEGAASKIAIGRRNARQKVRHKEAERRRVERERQFARELQNSVSALAPNDFSSRAKMLRSCQTFQETLDGLNRCVRRKKYSLKSASQEGDRESLRVEILRLSEEKKLVLSELQNIKPEVGRLLVADS